MADWLPELADDDLATLMEALEAWEDKDASIEMFGDVMEMLIKPTDSRMVEQIRSEREATKLEKRRAKAARKERSVLLRAKLLTLRNRRHVERTVGATSDEPARKDP